MGRHPRGFQHCSMLQLEFYEFFFVTSIQLFHPTFTCLSTRPSFQVKLSLARFKIDPQFAECRQECRLEWWPRVRCFGKVSPVRKSNSLAVPDRVLTYLGLGVIGRSPVFGITFLAVSDLHCKRASRMRCLLPPTRDLALDYWL